MKKMLVRMGLTLAVLLVVIQFFRPERSNPAETPGETLEAEVGMPAEVRAIFDRSCADCHSHRTRWPWYSAIAPASWIVAGHVKEARSHMNVSIWDSYLEPEAATYLKRMCSFTREGSMPLASYLWLHPSARMSDAEVETLCEWSLATRERLTGASSTRGDAP